MLSHEIKNKNILSRFETKELGSKIRKYTIFFKNKKKAHMICMNGQTLAQATESCIARFGPKFDYVKG